MRDAELTEHLTQRIAHFLQDRRPVSACAAKPWLPSWVLLVRVGGFILNTQVIRPKRNADAEAQLTLPKWDFGRLDARMDGGTLRAPTVKGKAAAQLPWEHRTLRSHHISASSTALDSSPADTLPPTVRLSNVLVIALPSTCDWHLFNTGCADAGMM